MKQAEAARAAFVEARDAAQTAQRESEQARAASESAAKEVAERSAVLEELERSARARQQELDASCAEVDELHNACQTKFRDLAQRKQELDMREAEIDGRHQDLLTREQELDAGFTAWKRERLEALEAERAELRASVDRDRREAHEKLDAIRNETMRLTYELDERRSNRLLEIESEARERAEAICEQARSDASRILEERRAELDELERSLAERQERVEIESEENERTRRRLERERERLPEELRSEWDRERARFEAQLGSLLAERDRAEADAAGLRERVAAVESVLEGRGVEAVVELEKARKDNTREIAKLRKQLEAAPSQADADEADRLREDVRNARASIIELRTQVDSISRERDELRLQIGERDAVRRERDVLRASAKTLEHHVDKLEKQVHALKGRSDEHQIFPGCAEIVTAAATPPKSLGGAISNVSDFAIDVRNAMAALESPRYYSPQQVRAWLGGLASSRLQLLEGLSGTGKTSLPKAFAEAIGAGCRVVEVQAGWRDRNDLLGHYNAFEDRFEEMPFLHALVEAQQPQYADQPYFIVLDEMNLSYVEHYFADLLSLLGAQDEGSGTRRIQLLGRPLENLPAGIEAVAGQTMVIVPDNVFFVGTANQDETTKGFADKTYDRAMVMRLDRRAES
ncbi:MAG: hypothetical protein KC766_39865, partial [Myxococcales bacterium]|nr:hypothetical protein [Myxococcales bacterium]